MNNKVSSLAAAPFLQTPVVCNISYRAYEFKGIFSISEDESDSFKSLTCLPLKVFNIAFVFIVH